LGGPRQVGQREIEEHVLCRFRRGRYLGNVSVVGRAVLDGVVEDGRVRGEPGHRELVDVALQRPVIQQLAGDIVEPQALAEIVEHRGWFHRVAFRLDAKGCEATGRCGSSPTSKSLMRSIVTSAGGKAPS